LRGYNEAYQTTEKYRAALQRYRQSPKFRQARQRYRQSDQARADMARANAKRRARQAGAVLIEPIDRTAIFQLDGGLCHLCDGAVDPERFHLDHLIPLALQPIEAAWNYAVAHPTCNLRKGVQLTPQVLSVAARARWQQRRPGDLARLLTHLEGRTYDTIEVDTIPGVRYV
jgi:5-methylcytosine-specific restriction endonuclease McrA